MLLDSSDCELFFRLHRRLMFFANQRLNVIAEGFATPDDFAEAAPDARLRLRNALNDRLDLVEAFVAENPARLADNELEIIHSWRHLVAGRFYVFRELKNYTVFLASGSPVVAYGVVALSQPFEALVGPHLPVLTETVLLPFKGRIVYDSLLNTFNISFGGGVRRLLNQGFKEAKAQVGIITSLPMSNEPRPAKSPRTRPAPKPKKPVDERLAFIINLTDQFCASRLNDEYAALCRKLAEKLARKRPSPLASGSPYVWACAIVRTIGWVNFLHDKSQTPHMPLIDIDAAFGVAESTGAAKLATIRKMLRIHQLDPEWSFASRRNDDPIDWVFRRGRLPF